MIVIGSGPGGYVAAVRAAQLGLRTAVVEKAPKPGGTCLHTGCIPTKVLLHIAAVYSEIRKCGEIGINVPSASIDYAKVSARKDAVVGGLAKAVEGLLKRRKVDLFAGMGTIADTGALHAIDVKPEKGEAQRLTAKKLLLATGSAVRSLPNLPVDGKTILSSDDILKLDTIPKSLLVVGAGAVGVEFATVFAAFGAKVTVVEVLPTMLPIEDEEIGRALGRAFKKRGLDVRTSSRVEKVEPDKGGVRVTIASEGAAAETISVEKVLVAVGRRPVSDGLGLEKTRVAVEKGFVKVDANGRTAEAGIFAIGDLIAIPNRPHPQLAHVASHEGILVAAELAGEDVRADRLRPFRPAPIARPRSRGWDSPRRRRSAGSTFASASSRPRQLEGHDPRRDERIREDRGRGAVRRGARRAHHRAARHRADRRVRGGAQARGDRARDLARDPSPSHALRSADGSRAWGSGPSDPRSEPHDSRAALATLTYLEAIRLALAEEMRRDERVFLMGEDIGPMAAPSR